MKWEKGFNAHLPLKDDDELPRSGVEDDQKEGTELLKAGDDEKPKAVLEANGEDGWATPVEEPPKPFLFQNHQTIVSHYHPMWYKPSLSSYHQ